VSSEEDMNHIDTIGGVKVYEDDEALVYKTGATINGDGSPHCYHEDDSKGLDYLANAGSPGNWWGIAVGNDGEPIVQSIYDVAPGYYVSTTALVVPGHSSERPEHYLDSERYPFVVVPGSFGCNWKIGDIGMCWNEKSGDNMYCATGDIGPSTHIGEISMLLGRCLGLDYSPKSGGTEYGIVYVVFPGSDPGYKPWREKAKVAEGFFNKGGGMKHLKEVANRL